MLSLPADEKACGVITLSSGNQPSISPECSPAMYRSLTAGCAVEIEEEDCLANGLLGGTDNQCTFPMVKKYVDAMVLLSEEQIAVEKAFTLNK